MIKDLEFRDDFEGDNITLKMGINQGDLNYPFNIYVNDGFGEGSIAFSKAEAMAMKNWLEVVLSPLENE